MGNYSVPQYTLLSAKSRQVCGHTPFLEHVRQMRHECGCDICKKFRKQGAYLLGEIKIVNYMYKKKGEEQGNGQSWEAAVLPRRVILLLLMK